MPAASYQRTPDGEIPARRASVEMFTSSDARPCSHCKVKRWSGTFEQFGCRVVVPVGVAEHAVVPLALQGRALRDAERAVGDRPEQRDRVVAVVGDLLQQLDGLAEH